MRCQHLLFLQSDARPPRSPRTHRNPPPPESSAHLPVLTHCAPPHGTRGWGPLSPEGPSLSRGAYFCFSQIRATPPILAPVPPTATLHTHTVGRALPQTSTATPMASLSASFPQSSQLQTTTVAMATSAARKPRAPRARGVRPAADSP